MLYPTELRAPRPRLRVRAGGARERLAQGPLFSEVLLVNCTISHPLAGITCAFLILPVISGCRERVPPRHLVRLQAFTCSRPAETKCSGLPRGAAIARDSLPPVDEAFQVWAWHPGAGKVVYRIEWQSPFFVGDSGAPVAAKQSETELEAATDSSTLSYNFASAARTRYVLKVLLMTPKDRIEDQDSLVWDYTRAASP